MTPSNYTQEELLTAVYNWGSENHEKGFDTSFVEDLYNTHESGIELSDEQEEALYTIVNKWDIDVDYWKDD